MPTMLAQFTVVRVKVIREDRFDEQPVYDARPPQVGDIGTVLEIYKRPEQAYEVECSDPTTGETVWLTAMYADELEPVMGA